MVEEGKLERPSIAFLIPSLDAGGAERQLVGLAAGMQEAGWRVRVITLYGGGQLRQDLDERGVKVVDLDKRGRWDILGFSLRLLRHLRRDPPNILHSYLVTPNIASAILRPFIPGVRIVWGVRASNMDLRRYGRFASLAFRASCLLARRADLIICNSTSGRAFHEARGYPARRMVVVPNGIDVQRFSPDRRPGLDVRSAWDVAPDMSLVGLVGRLDPMKDHPSFLRAAVLVAASHDDVRFVCVGHGPSGYRAELEALTADLGLADRVTWTGGRADLPRVYNALDLVVSSSAWGEGFPNVVAEAMACGIPCVVTDVGDSAMVVGATGWVCPAHDPARLAQAIIAALSADLSARGEAARARIVDEFGEERRERTTVDHLERLLAETASPRRLGG